VAQTRLRRIFKLIPEDKVEAITLVYRMFYLQEELARARHTVHKLQHR